MNVVTMSGEIKFQGDVGPRGPKGEKGDKPIIGVDYFTEADRTHMVGEVTEDANSVFNQNVATKTNEFNNNVTSKTTGFNENTVSKTNAYNQNAEEKTQTYDKNAITKITEYNNNASTKVSDFNENAQNKISVYNSNASDKLNAYNTNAIQKETAFDNNAEEQTTTFNSNATTKTNTFNTNASSKTTSFNNNATSKTTAFDTHVADKTTEFNENATAQTNTFNDNVASKTEEFNQNVIAKTEEFNASAESLEKELDWLKSIQDTSKASGENVYFDNAKNYPMMSLKGEGKTEQVTTTGKQLFDKENANILKGFLNHEDKIYTSGDSARTLYIDCKENTTYTISKPLGTRFRTATSSSIPSSGNALNIISHDGLSKITRTTNAGDKYILVYYYSSSYDTTITEQEILDTIQIEEGTEATAYEPYTGLQPAPNPDFPQEIKAISEASYKGVGKNLIDLTQLNTTSTPIRLSNAGSPMTNKEINSVTLTPSGAWSNMYLDFGENYFNENEDFVISAKFLETVNGRTSQVGFTIYGSNNNSNWDTIKSDARYTANYNSLLKVATTANVKTYKYVRIRIWSNSTDVSVTSGESVINVSELMVARGTDDTYEPYQESTLPIDLQGNELASVGTVSDKLLIDRKGNVAIEKNVGKVVLDGSEDWRIGDGVTQGYKYLYCTGISETPVSFVTICDKLQSYTKDVMTNSIPVTVSTVGLSKSTTNNLRVLFEQSLLSDISTNTKALESFKSWLQENNVTVYYELATPELISLGTISNLEIFKGINNIVVETNLGNMQIEVEYVEDLQKRIEEIDLLIGDLDLALENLTVGGGVS